MEMFCLNESKTNTSIGQTNLEEIITRSQCQKGIFFSFELVRCKNDDKEFYKKIFSDTKDCSPLFYSLTWHNGPCLNDNYFASLETLPEFPNNILFHLAARGLKRNIVLKILHRAFELDIKNLFIIRGDGNPNDGDFNYAVDLIKFIKEQYDKKFCIGVAGYPNQHPESLSKEADLHYLKEKVEAGASFIITQIILESSSFINFVKDCRNYGINVPIIPLIMPILR
ncbi:hypothetical protein PV327_004950 [Microctonus hyperodae]|uniref:Methylenetetrahydrofolate reductase (NAD(P)H) n=1 Tax=Microctonus hyperodae TaxID=165561 RepID=A0AA39FDP3_MICHY|nr:hypothetical protein PV327_004950 [Microctonus hyperodae]